MENVKFKKFLHFICPGFTPTTRQTIAGPCLDMAFAETSAKVNLFSVIVTIIITVVTDNNASDYVSDDLLEICLSQQFWLDLSSIISFLEPLVQAVALLEGDKSISNVLKVCRDTFRFLIY